MDTLRGHQSRAECALPLSMRVLCAKWSTFIRSGSMTATMLRDDVRL